MLKGDLTSTPLAPLLLDLATDAATGCLSVIDSTGDEAQVYLKNGLVYAVWVPGSRPQLGAKLVSSGALAPEALSEALEAQRTELQGWRLGELLVHLGYVDQPVVEAFVREQVHEALWDLMRWTEGTWRFRKNAKTREDVGPPMVIVELLESLRERGYEWQTISAVVHGPSAVPMLSTRGDSAAETTLDNDAWSMLCKIDGERTVAELARDCGYTLFEAGNVIVTLVQAGFVDIAETVDLEDEQMYGASVLASALAGDGADEPPAEEPEDDDALARLARLVTKVAGDHGDPEDGGSTVAPAQRLPEPDVDHSLTVPLHRNTSESFASSIARVSTALSDVLGPAPDLVEELDPLVETHTVRRAAGDEQAEEDRRRRIRSAAAAELISAQALADALRPDRRVHDDLIGDDPPRLIDEAKAAEREREEAERHAAEEAAREAAERFARAAAEEAERLAAEQVAREEVERLAREEAERLAREEAERLAAEQAAREEAERLAAEQAAREEAERLAAEQAAREEAERLAAEEAARLAAEQAAREEAERAAAEEAARLAAEEAERLAREEAERRAEEEVARLEAERRAQEKAERVARRKAEKAAAAEAARRADEAAAAHAMLIELNATAPDPPQPDVQEELVAPTPEPEPDPEPVPVGAASVGQEPDVTDTASLLRELSFLGTEEEEDQPRLKAPTSPRAPRPSSDDKKPRKKIGLFGL